MCLLKLLLTKIWRTAISAYRVPDWCEEIERVSIIGSISQYSFDLSYFIPLFDSPDLKGRATI